MGGVFSHRSWMHLVFSGLLLAGLVLPHTTVSAAEAVPPARKPVPVSVDDLRTIEKKVRELAKKTIPSTVGVQVGQSQGSGVIVSADGYVLTAAHVIGAPNRPVTISFADGKEVSGKTLGVDRRSDAGLIKINGDGPWPHVEIGDSNEVHAGDWCVALGHPGGYQKDRPPVLRSGRVLLTFDNVLQTDCTLVGGDSGGPLFDLDGRVIGIHSRIGQSTNWNFHVPTALYQADWDRLVAAETLEPEKTAFLGVGGEDHEDGALVTQATEGFPAAKADIRAGDIITKVNGKPVGSFEQLARRIGQLKPEDEVTIELIRGEETLTKRVTLAAR